MNKLHYFSLLTFTEDADDLRLRSSTGVIILLSFFLLFSLHFQFEPLSAFHFPLENLRVGGIYRAALIRPRTCARDFSRLKFRVKNMKIDLSTRTLR